MTTDTHMSFADRQADERKRYALTRKWNKRITKTGMSRRQFCLKYGFDESWMCRLIKGAQVPDWDTAHRIERALEKEKV